MIDTAGIEKVEHHAALNSETTNACPHVALKLAQQQTHSIYLLFYNF